MEEHSRRGSPKAIVQKVLLLTMVLLIWASTPLTILVDYGVTAKADGVRGTTSSYTSKSWGTSVVGGVISLDKVAYKVSLTRDKGVYNNTQAGNYAQRLSYTSHRSPEGTDSFYIAPQGMSVKMTSYLKYEPSKGSMDTYSDSTLIFENTKAKTGTNSCKNLLKKYSSSGADTFSSLSQGKWKSIAKQCTNGTQLWSYLANSQGKLDANLRGLVSSYKGDNLPVAKEDDIRRGYIGLLLTTYTMLKNSDQKSRWEVAINDYLSGENEKEKPVSLLIEPAVMIKSKPLGVTGGILPAVDLLEFTTNVGTANRLSYQGRTPQNSSIPKDVAGNTVAMAQYFYKKDVIENYNKERIANVSAIRKSNGEYTNVFSFVMGTPLVRKGRLTGHGTLKSVNKDSIKFYNYDGDYTEFMETMTYMGNVKGFLTVGYHRGSTTPPPPPDDTVKDYYIDVNPVLEVSPSLRQYTIPTGQDSVSLLAKNNLVFSLNEKTATLLKWKNLFDVETKHSKDVKLLVELVRTAKTTKTGNNVQGKGVTPVNNQIVLGTEKVVNRATLMELLKGERSLVFADNIFDNKISVGETQDYEYKMSITVKIKHPKTGVEISTGKKTTDLKNSKHIGNTGSPSYGDDPILHPYIVVNPIKTEVQFGGATSGTKPLGKSVNIQLKLKSVATENAKWQKIMANPYNDFVDVYVGMERSTMMQRPATDKNTLTSAHPTSGEAQIVPGNYKKISRVTWETLYKDTHYFNFTDHVEQNIIEYGERQLYYYTFSYALRYSDPTFLTRSVTKQTKVYETEQGVSEFTTSGTPLVGSTVENYDVGGIDPVLAVTPSIYEMASGQQVYGEKLPNITIYEDSSSLAHTQSINAWETLEGQVKNWGTIDVGITLNREASNEREQYTHLYPWNKQGQTMKWTWEEFKAFLNGTKTIDMIDNSLSNTRLGSAKEINYNYSANITAKVPLTTKTGQSLTAVLSKNTNTDSIMYVTCLGADSTVSICDETIKVDPEPVCTDCDKVEEPDVIDTDGGAKQGEFVLETPKKDILVYADKLRHDVDIFIRDEAENEGQMFQYNNKYKDVDQFKVTINIDRLSAPTGVQGAQYVSELGTIGEVITLDREDMLTYLRGESEFLIKDKTYDNKVVASVDHEYVYKSTVKIEYAYVDEEGTTQNVIDNYTTNTDYSTFRASAEPAPEKPELIVYNNKSVSYSEIKQDTDGQKFGTTANEEFDAMAGVPSNKRLYYAVGGTEFVIDVELEYRQNIWSDWRTYHSYFTQVESEHMQQDRADETQTVPSPSGASSSDLTVTPHGGDLTITATWTGTTPYTGNLAWSDHSQSGADKWDDNPYNKAKEQANAWIALVSPFQLKNQSASEAKEKTWNSWTGEAGLGIKADSNSHPAGSVSIGRDAVPAVPCSGTPCTGGSPAIPYQATTGAQGTAGSYTITVSATIPAHTVCGPECEYILPQVNDTWKQRVAYDYMKVVKVDIYKLTEGRLTKVDNVFGDGNSVISSKIVDGEQQLFSNIAQKNANNIVDGSNSAKLEGDGTRTWDKTAWSKQGSAVQASKYGRLRYSLEPLQHDKVVWNEGVRTNKSAGANDNTSTDGWNGTKYSAAIGQDNAKAKGIKYTNSGYTTYYDYHDRECSQQYTSTSDCATDVDKKTTEWAKFEARRTTQNVATVISDMLILQTSHGDQSIIYFEKDTVSAETQQQWSGLKGEFEGQEAKGHVERIHVTKKQMWEENKNSAYEWSINKVNVGSYNGKYAQPANKYDGYNVEDGTIIPNHKGILETKFDKIAGDPVTRLRAKSDTTRLEMYASKSIVPTIPNGEYLFGTSQAFYKSILRFESVNPFVDYTKNGSTMDVEPYIYKQFSSKQSNFESQEGLVYNAPYSDTHNRINNVVIHTPVSTEYAMVLSEQADKDQRIDMPEGGASALNDEKNKLRVCPLDPADCQFRVLNCKHSEDAVLAQFDFSSVGMYEITNKTKGTGVLYNATNGVTFSGGKMNAKGTRFSLNFADIGLINRRSVTVGVKMDLAMPTSMSGETMIASFDKYGVVYNPVTNKLGFVVDDTDMVRYTTYDLKGKTVKIEVQMSMGSVLDSNIVVDGTKLAMTNTTQYPKDLTGMIGNTLNIGSWKKSTSYPANFTVDNLEIIKKGGSDAHTESCYIYTEEHAQGYIHIHTEDCYIFDASGNRQQICNSIGKKEISQNNIHVHDASCLVNLEELEEIYGGNTKATSQDFNYTGNMQTYTAQKAGSYTLETWGGQGANGVGTGGKGGYAKGTVNLTQGQTIYVYVGGQGTNNSSNNGGYNGGGVGYGFNANGAGGGGATDFRTGSTNLNSRIIVAGGGGGGAGTRYGLVTGGYGGGTTGGDASGSYGGTGGTQVSGGINNSTNGGNVTTQASLGTGGNSANYIADSDLWQGGGGGGYYGGAGGTAGGGGGGGSSYVGGLTNGTTLGGNTTQPSTTGATQLGHSGNGFARVTVGTVTGGKTGGTTGSTESIAVTGELARTTDVPVNYAYANGYVADVLVGTNYVYVVHANMNAVTQYNKNADGSIGTRIKTTDWYAHDTVIGNIQAYNSSVPSAYAMYVENGVDKLVGWGRGQAILYTWDIVNGIPTNRQTYNAPRTGVEYSRGGWDGGNYIYFYLNTYNGTGDAGLYRWDLRTKTTVPVRLVTLQNAEAYATHSFTGSGLLVDAQKGEVYMGTGSNNSQGLLSTWDLATGAYKSTIKQENLQAVGIAPIQGQAGNISLSALHPSIGYYFYTYSPLIVQVKINRTGSSDNDSVITETGIGDLTWQEMLGGIANWQDYVKVESGKETKTTKYNYTGGVQTFVAPANGTYTFKVVGASGGGNGGRGGQASGSKELKKGDVVNIYVGGTTNSTTGGYNGGGSTGSPAYGGGGASDIRINGTGLGNRIIVGAGGGGSQAGAGGDGGGLTGSNGTGSYGVGGTGGTQTSGGTGGSIGSLGTGGNGMQGGDGYFGGAGGGGYYGGGGSITDGSQVDDKGGAGGSSYYAGLTGGATTAGVNTGNGYVDVSVPSGEEITLDKDKLAKIIANLPTEINGKINPLFAKDLLNYNQHQHTGACKVVKVLACTEPHHDGGHYDGANSICWDACNNDEWHKQTAETEIIGKDGEVNTVRMADFLNIDEEFRIYFPNKGDFEQAPTMLGIGKTTATRGKGYYNSMDLTQYTQRKRVKFPFNVTHNGVLYLSQTWIELSVSQEYFDFRLVLANNEASAAEIEFDVIAINAQAPNSPVNDNDDDENNQERNAVLAARHGGIKRVYMDVVGRIGNFAVTDTEDLRFANLFKESANNGTFLIEGVVPTVNNQVQRKYYGDTVDMRGRKIGETGVGLNTYGYIKYLEKEPLTYPINANDHAKVGNNAVLNEEFLKPGYDVLGEIQTIGDYQKGTVRILPYYYKVNTKTNEIIPLDAYVLNNNGYVLVHEYQGADDGEMPTLTDYSVVMDWANESYRRNFNVEESKITNSVAEKIGKLIYGNYITESGMTAYGAINVEKMELPIGNYTTMGNAQRIVLNGYMRTFIGSNLTYGVNHNPDDTNSNGIQEEDENWRLEDFLWHGEAQRWHMKMGLPSSTIFVEHGVTPNEDSIKAIKATEGVVLMTADIIVIGDVYTLRYAQPGLTEFTVRVKGQTKTFNVAGLGLPPIVGLMDANLTASSDVSVQSTH